MSHKDEKIKEKRKRDSRQSTSDVVDDKSEEVDRKKILKGKSSRKNKSHGNAKPKHAEHVALPERHASSKKRKLQSEEDCRLETRQAVVDSGKSRSNKRKFGASEDGRETKTTLPNDGAEAKRVKPFRRALNDSTSSEKRKHEQRETVSVKIEIAAMKGSHKAKAKTKSTQAADSYPANDKESNIIAADETALEKRARKKLKRKLSRAEARTAIREDDLSSEGGRDGAVGSQQQSRVFPSSDKLPIASETAIYDFDDDSKRKKRKERKGEGRAEAEIEVDVLQPEPPSKKALRKAKKLATAELSIGAATIENDALDSKTSTKSTKQATTETLSKKTPYSIWIGNLPWAATKSALVDWFVTNSTMTADSITRVHLPPPSKAEATRLSLKPQNKGFAYVDFATEGDHAAALALSETKWTSRPVLIKDAKDYHGRPDQDNSKPDKKLKPQMKAGRRVCVKNLDYSITGDDLKTHFKPCGNVEKVQVAAFEDTGQCKGFGFILFETVEAAQAAVQGWVKLSIEQLPVEVKPEAKAGSKPRKWYTNRMHGREIHCEFAEDATTRYEKRFGKAKASHRKIQGILDAGTEVLRVSPSYEAMADISESVENPLTAVPRPTKQPSIAASEPQEEQILSNGNDSAHRTSTVDPKNEIASTESKTSTKTSTLFNEHNAGIGSSPSSSDSDRKRPKTSSSFAHRVIKRSIGTDRRFDESKARAKAKLDALNAQIGRRTGSIVEAKGTKTTFD